MTVFIILIGVCLVLSAFFSAAETGLTAASHSIIHKLKMEGSRRARMVSDLREKKEQLIGAILMGNNAAIIGASTLATTLAIQYYGDDDVVLGAVTAGMTLLMLIFGEVMPKTYALRNAEDVALGVAPVLTLLTRMLSPFTRAVQGLADGLFWVFNIRRQGSRISDTAELRGAIALHHEEGVVVKSERDMLGSILDLEEIEAGQVMIHRKDMVTLDAGRSVDQIADFMLNTPYTRMPVWQDDPDNIIGILHVKTLVHALRSHPDNPDTLDIRTILNKPWFIPETTTLREQLQAFREQHSHLAFVVDEYGALLGMITLEDILEEIVGQIEDESDLRAAQIRPGKDGSTTVDGRLSIRDLNRELGWNLPDSDAATVAGLIVQEAQLIPEAGQIFHFHGYRFEILKRKRNQITAVRIRPFVEEAGESGA